MSKAYERLPVEIWVDINGNATRTQFKGGVKYIRADERDRLREALESIRRHSVIAGSRGEYRQGQLDVLESVRRLVKAALTLVGQRHIPNEATE